MNGRTETGFPAIVATPWLVVEDMVHVLFESLLKVISHTIVLPSFAGFPQSTNKTSELLAIALFARQFELYKFIIRKWLLTGRGRT
jgi:hypothetical protein